MSQFTFKFHFEKKPDELITWTDTDNISDPFREYSRKIKENKEDLIFCYKGSSFKYDECDTNPSFKNEMFSRIEPNKTINIIAFPIRKTKNHKPSLKLSSSKETKENFPLDINANIEAKKEKKSVGDNAIAAADPSNKEAKGEEKEYFNDVLCPYCLTSAILENDGHKLNIINCNNFHHLPNITYDRFDTVDNFPNAKCGGCSKYKSQLTPPENQFYICSCGIYLCPECYTSHDKSHKKTEIENKNFHCLKHDKDYNSYCIDCNHNICDDCTDSHKGHEVLKYVHLKPKEEYVDKISKEIERQKEALNKFLDFSRKVVDEVINEVNNYINNYILIEKSLIRRYKNNSRNFQLLQNLRNNKLFYNNTFFNDLIVTDMEKLNKLDALEKISHLYSKINNAKRDGMKSDLKSNINIPKNEKDNKNEMTITYQIKEIGLDKKVKLFDSVFVDNNRDKLELIINGKKEKELIEYYRIPNNEKELKVQIVEKKPVTNMSYMFNNCKNLVSVDSKKWDTTNVKSMEALFQLCSFQQAPDISFWKTQNLTSMRAMFTKCINLKGMPDMTKWNTQNVKDMSLLFNGCISIESIPKFPIWNTQNVEDMSYMFSRCKNLKDLHNIGKLNTIKVRNMCGVFNRCESLVTLPDIARWNMSNVTDISIIFQFCSNLKELKDIARWNLLNVKDISGVFSECGSLKTLPKIGNWNMPNVECMCGLFNGCTSLTDLPDLSKWNTSHVTDMSGMFCDCKLITKLPNISNWNTSNVTDMSYLFDGCSELKDISPIRNWNKNKIIDKTKMFNDCPKLKADDTKEWQ